jgi:hypothetical protein
VCRCAPGRPAVERPGHRMGSSVAFLHTNPTAALKPAICVRVAEIPASRHGPVNGCMQLLKRMTPGRGGWPPTLAAPRRARRDHHAPDRRPAGRSVPSSLNRNHNLNRNRLCRRRGCRRARTAPPSASPRMASHERGLRGVPPCEAGCTPEDDLVTTPITSNDDLSVSTGASASRARRESGQTRPNPATCNSPHAIRRLPSFSSARHLLPVPSKERSAPSLPLTTHPHQPCLYRGCVTAKIRAEVEPLK